MTNLRDFKRNKALKRDLRHLIGELEYIKFKLIKYKIYKEINSIYESANIGIIRYKKILEKLENENK